MCLAIYRPRGASGLVTEQMMSTAYAGGNNDSYGVMWARDKKLHTYKDTDPKHWQNFMTLLEMLQEEDVPMGIHLRLATHGLVNKANAHPIKVHPGLGLIHNGILYPTGGKPMAWQSDDSDTVMFAKRLRQLPTRWWGNPTFRSFVEDWIGPYNKVVLLDRLGRATILNQEAGHWKNGIWFSNHDYEGASCYSFPYRHQEGWEFPTAKVVQYVAPEDEVAAVKFTNATLCLTCWIENGPEAVEALLWPLGGKREELAAKDVEWDAKCDLCGDWIVVSSDLVEEGAGQDTFIKEATA